MTVDSPSPIVPKLRFPEFRDNGQWKEMRLADVAPLQRGFDLPSTELESGDVPVVYSNGIRNYHNVGMATGPGLVTGRSGTIGNLHYIEDGAYWPHNTSLWVTSFNSHHPKFVYFLYSAIGLDRFASGSGVPTLNRNDVHAFLARVPPTVQEQGKIAACLGSLDDLITAEGRKLEALRQHKQGLMQQLFPQPGETVPRLRFPEFESAGDWKLDQIGNVASITKGKRVSKADITKDGATPCIRYAELYTHYAEVIDEVVSHTNVPHDNLTLSQTEDVIVPASGETRVDIARAACVLSEHVALGSDLNVLRSDLYGPFFSYLLNSPLRHSIARVAQGDTVAHLYPKQLSQVWLAYPLRLEQQKIADCLGALNDLIVAEVRKIEALRQHKQGLMQQMFPSLER